MALTLDPDHTVLTQAQAADLLATTERHLRRLAARDELRPVRIGGKNRYRLGDVLRYIEEQPPTVPTS